MKRYGVLKVVEKQSVCVNHCVNKMKDSLYGYRV